ncbi:alpha/beta hydrolase [Nocardia sp. NPDC052001]|uniref:alpha/beta fold hydrolase n=1 Tax=Nocardia sp. NPDC052001 TaxID=3154853 RepID=UPI003419DF28
MRSADGTRIHVEVFGPEHGYPIVLSHGVCCGIRFWSHQIADLAENYRVIAFDHRGHGLSARPPQAAHTIQCLGDDLAAVLRSTLRSGERALLAGHSMGGITIQAWADQYPADVARFADATVLMNTSPGELADGLTTPPAGSRMPESMTALMTSLSGLVIETFGGTPVPVRLPLRSALLSPLTVGSTATPAARALIQELILTTPATTRGHFIRTLAALRTEQLDHSRLTAPTLVIGSTDDRLLPMSHSIRLESLLPNPMGLLELPGGHCGPVEQPTVVTAALHRLAQNARESTSA